MHPERKWAAGTLVVAVAASKREEPGHCRLESHVLVQAMGAGGREALCRPATGRAPCPWAACTGFVLHFHPARQRRLFNTHKAAK